MQIYLEEGSVYRYELMTEESITWRFRVDQPLNIGIGDSLQDGYIILDAPDFSYDEATGVYVYTLKQHKAYWWWKNVIFKYRPQTGAAEASWALTSNIVDFGKILEANTGYVVSIDEDAVKGGLGTAQALSFSNSSIIDALNAIADKWECEWWVSGNTIYLGICRNNGSAGTFSLGTNVETINASSGQEESATRFYVFGSEKNIPSWYRKTFVGGVKLYPQNYRRTKWTDSSVALTNGSSATAEEKSYASEDGHVACVDYTAYMTGGETGTYHLLFGAPLCRIVKRGSSSALGNVYMSLRASEDGETYKTIATLKNGLLFDTTDGYILTHTGSVYMQLHIEYESATKEYVNIKPTFDFHLAKVLVNGVHDSAENGLVGAGIDGLIKGSLPSICFATDDAEIDAVNNGVVASRLMLPQGVSYIDRVEGSAVIESVITFDDIYPRISASVTNLEEKSYTDETTLDTGEVVKNEWKAYRMDAPEGFSSDDVLSGTALSVRFTSGLLNGMEFEVAYNPDGHNESDARAQVFELVRNENYGRALPDAVLAPAEGDGYDILNVDVSALGDDIIEEAENRLKDKATEYIETLNADKSNYECTMIVGVGDEYNVGDSASVVFGNITRASRIIAKEIKLDIPSDHAKYTLGDSPSYSNSGALSKSVSEIVHNATAYMEGGNIKILKTGDAQAPSDNNVLSSLRAFATFASRHERGEFTAEQRFAGGFVSSGYSRIEGTLQVRSGVESDDYESGAAGYRLGHVDGEATLEVDNIIARGKVSYPNIEINGLTHVQGALVISSARTTFSKVMGKAAISSRGAAISAELDNLSADDLTTYESEKKEKLTAELAELGNIRSGDFYRCWFDSDDKLISGAGFVVGDLVRFGTYNLRTNRSYWRKVVGVGADYIDLGNETGEMLTGSGTPMAGDAVVQFGNLSSRARQSVILLSSNGGDAPSIKTYHGVNSFALPDAAATEQYYDATRGAMVFRVYGDMYVGAQDRAQYMEWRSGKVTIKGDLSLGSVGDDNLQTILGNIDEHLTGTDEELAGMASEVQDVNTALADVRTQLDASFDVYQVDNIAERDDDGALVERMAPDAYAWLPSASWAAYSEHVGDFLLTSDGICYLFTYDEELGYGWRIVTDSYLIACVQDIAELNTRMEDIAADNIVTLQEKAALKTIWENEEEEYSALADKCDELNLTDAKSELASTYSNLAAIMHYIFFDKADEDIDLAACILEVLGTETPYNDYWQAYTSAKMGAQAAVDALNHTAVVGLDYMADDAYITPQEKIMLSLLWNTIKAEYTQLSAEAESVGVVHADYDKHYGLMGVMMDGDDGVLKDMATLYELKADEYWHAPDDADYEYEKTDFAIAWKTYYTLAAKVRARISAEQSSNTSDVNSDLLKVIAELTNAGDGSVVKFSDIYNAVVNRSNDSGTMGGLVTANNFSSIFASSTDPATQKLNALAAIVAEILEDGSARLYMTANQIEIESDKFSLKDGVLNAVEGNFSGQLKRVKTIVTASNYVNYGSWENVSDPESGRSYYTFAFELDKLGTWVEFESLPTQREPYVILLPSNAMNGTYIDKNCDKTQYELRALIGARFQAFNKTSEEIALMSFYDSHSGVLNRVDVLGKDGGFFSAECVLAYNTTIVEGESCRAEFVRWEGYIGDKMTEDM